MVWILVLHWKSHVSFLNDFNINRFNGLFTGFQFAYTTIFGAYSAYLFYKTGHFMSIFIVHAFCNHMGFPDIVEVVGYKKTKKAVICSLFVLGFVAWCFLLKPLTEPSWYYNKPTWYSVWWWYILDNLDGITNLLNISF